MVDRLAQKVAHRYVAAAYLTPRWFRERKTQLREILGSKLRKGELDWWSFQLPDKLDPWFDRFLVDFQDAVPNPKAQDAVKRRVESAKNYIQGVAERVERLLKHTKNVNFEDAESFLKWYAATRCHDAILERVDTIGDLLKWSYYIQDNVIENLARRTLRQLTPDEKESLTARDDPFGDKYKALARLGFEKSAIRALKRNKLDWDPLKWVDQVYEMLVANYSEQAIQEGDDLSEFDLYGMKVVIDDSTVEPKDVQAYIAYLKEAYAALNRKGFKSAWYGTVFIQCNACGGVNKNTGGGVGGHYVIQRDTVSIFSRPSGFIPELVVHELGHRYWYKQLSQAQRAKFESLVKVYKPQKLPPVAPNKVMDAISVVHRWDEKVDSILSVFQYNMRQAKSPEDKQKVIDQFAEDLHAAVVTKKEFDVYGAMTGVLSQYEAKDLDPSLSKLLEDFTGTNESAEVQLRRFSIREEIRKFFREHPDTDRAVEKYVAEAMVLLKRAVAAALKYIEAAQKAMTRDFAEGDVRPVPAVSDYGKSNIDEAWAEVFAHYVLEFDITRDQADSFKSILKLGMVESVVERFSDRRVASSTPERSSSNPRP